MLTSRDYTLDDLRKLVVRKGLISNPKHSWMFWGHIWIKADREEPLEDRELIHKGIHMVQISRQRDGSQHELSYCGKI